MPSFDIVSELDLQEAANAVDQANRELSNRFDFKGVSANFELEGVGVSVTAQEPFQVEQMIDILKSKAIKRGIDPLCFRLEPLQKNLAQAKQIVTLQQGIEKELAKKISKFIKDSKLKVQVSIQGEKLRVTGKKRDDLQATIAVLKDQSWPLPLQYENFRD